MDVSLPVLVIDHEPRELQELADTGVDVDLCGHTHDGQVFPGNIVIRFFWENPCGYLKKGNMHNIVTSGVGLFEPNMRVGKMCIRDRDETRRRALFGFRHNHCYTSPVYREKVHIINKKLAQEVATHPGVILWHISNEYGGECHCPLCQKAFRNWLKEKYQTIENLNDKWCTTFWSHTYNSFDQIESPSKIGEDVYKRQKHRLRM